MKEVIWIYFGLRFGRHLRRGSGSPTAIWCQEIKSLPRMRDAAVDAPVSTFQLPTCLLAIESMVARSAGWLATDSVMSPEQLDRTKNRLTEKTRAGLWAV